MDDLVSITTQNIHKIVFKTASVCFKLWTNFEPGDGVLSSYNNILTPLHLETKFKL